MGRFSTVWLISAERVIGFSEKFYHKCILGQGSPVGGNPADLDADSVSRPVSPGLAEKMRSLTAVVIVYSDKMLIWSVIFLCTPNKQQ